MNKPFVNLHTHSFYSILQATPKPAALVDRAIELGCPAVALTDTDAGHGLVDFYQSASKAEGDIKPILGVEIKLALDGRFEKRIGIDGKEGHIVLLAKNEAGHKNLMALMTRASLEGFYEHPRIDLEILAEHRDGIIVLTGSHTSTLAQILDQKGEEGAQTFIAQLQDAVGKENVYGEIVARQRPAIKSVNEFLAKSDMPLVVTSDAHYLQPDKAESAEILLCIKTGEQINNPYRKKELEDNWFKSWEEMERELSYIDSEVLENARLNSLAIAESVDLELTFGENLLPEVDLPNGATAKDELRRLCEENIEYRYAPYKDFTREEIQERLDFELGVIGRMGFEAYFLITEDFIRFAKDNGIAVGPGRGSAAGSIVAYLLEITNIDPLGYELLFERFLNPDRISMPDIDIDFSDERREEVIDYVTKKYGTDRVSQVCTFGTLSAKAALKDVGRVQGIPFQDMNAWTKLLPNRPGFKLKEAEEIADFKVLIDSNYQLKKVYDHALELEGCIRHVSVHACAVIIGKDAIVQNSPQQYAPGSETIKITQWDYYKLEALGLLKMDFLGLKNLSIIERCLEIIKHTKGEEIDMNKIPIDDAKTFEMIARGETTGVFQFESPGMRRYLKELKPTEFENLVAMNALYRPGPMENIPDYIKGKKNPKSVKYFDPVLEPLLKKTYGITIYQEQVMKMAQVYSGYTPGEADVLRKAVGKKIKKLMAEQREKFIQGGVDNGHKKKDAEKLFDDIIVPFGNYGFNRSHSVCYARIAYETAYLRANYPIEFMASMMTTDRNNIDRVVIEMNECAAMGIDVLPPSVNESLSSFTVVKEDEEEKIRFGLTAIKGLGEDTVDIIIKERKENGKFENLQDFAKRVPAKVVNKKTLEALTFSGALDSFGERAAIVQSVDEISKFARETQDKADMGQMGLFGAESSDIDFVLPDVKTTKEDVLNWERESLGMFVSDHPLKGLEGYLNKYGKPIGELTEDEDGGEKRTVHGIVTMIKRIQTKAGKDMGIFEIEDLSGKLQVTVFPYKFATLWPKEFSKDDFLRVVGKVEERNGELQIIAEEIAVGNLQEITQSPEATEESREATKPEKIEITVPENASKNGIEDLKKYLVSIKDESGIPAIVYVNGKKVELPFKIKWSPSLMREVGEYF